MSFHKLLGMKLIHAAEGKSEVRLPLREQLNNSGGITHGGAVASLIDTAIGTAIHSQLPEGTYAVTAELNMNFTAPGIGKELVAYGEVLNHGSRLVIGEAKVYRDDGKLMAVGRGTFALIGANGTRGDDALQRG